MNNNDQNLPIEQIDVFLCHNSQDKDEIRRIADDLKQLGVTPWLDEREIETGSSWKSAIEDQIDKVKSAAIFVGDNGIGKYQNREILLLINEREKRELPMVPVYLSTTSLNPVLPFFLKETHAVDFRKINPDPLQKLIEFISGEKQLSQKNISQSANDSRKLGQIAASLTRAERSFLETVLELVEGYWIDGILNASIYNQTPIYLEKVIAIHMVEKNDDETVNNLYKLIEDNTRIKSYTNNESILDVTKYLLILGEPGSGKTTTLLLLARRLVARAKTTPQECIPIILNLSSWKKGQPISEWIVATLGKTHNLPIKDENLRNWLRMGYFIPLLDGLDEVIEEYQADCVEAINSFIGDHQPPGLVVSCRLKNYHRLPQQLNLSGAIRIEPLNQSQITQYIYSLGPTFHILELKITEDPDLLELAKSPFMLSIMTKVFESGSSQPFEKRSQSPDSWGYQLIETYVNDAFHHTNAIDKRFPKNKTLYWLKWLAQKVTDDSQTITVEDMQPDWLSGSEKKVCYRIFSAINFGILVGVMSLLILLITHFLNHDTNIDTTFGLVTGLMLGLMVNTDNRYLSGLVCLIVFSLVGILFNGQANPGDWILDGIYLVTLVIFGIGSIDSIKTVEKMSWSWNYFLNILLKSSLKIGLLSGLIVGLYTAQREGINNGISTGLIFGLLFGLIAGLMNGMIQGFTNKKIKTKKMPNQGIRLSFTNGFHVYFRSLLLVVSVIGLIYVTFSTFENSLDIALILGLQISLVIALNHGLAAVIKHFSLRLTLFWYGYAPLKLIPFLDYCTQLLLINRGRSGSYMFIHRHFLEYFANLEISTNSKPKNIVTKQNGHQH